MTTEREKACKRRPEPNDRRWQRHDSLREFTKKLKRSQWHTHGPGGHWFTKKNLKWKISCQTPFNRVYRLEIKSVMLVFLTAFVNYCPFIPSLLLAPPPPFPVWICILQTNIEYGVIWVEGPHTDETPAAKSLYWSIFLDDDIGIAFYQSNLSTGKIVGWEAKKKRRKWRMCFIGHYCVQ